MVEGYPDSIAGWGAPGIFKEAGRLLGKYFRLLHPFIAAFFLPVVVIELLELWGVAWGISHHHHHPHPHPHPHPHHHHGRHHPRHPLGWFVQAFYIHSHEGGGPRFNENLYAPAPSPHPHPPHHHPHLLPLLLLAAFSILAWLLTSLAIASIAKAIAHIYSQDPPEYGQDSSITKSIFKSLPSALYRIFITTLLIILVTFITFFIVSFPFHLLNYFFHSKVIVIINHVLVDIAFLVLGFVFLLALEVAVLEPDNYGLAALRRSWKLVQSKIGASLIFFLVNIVVGGVFSKLATLVIILPASGKWPFWTVYLLGVVWAVIYLAFTVYFLVVAVVLYFSTKLKVESEGEYLPVNTREGYTPPVPSEN